MSNTQNPGAQQWAAVSTAAHDERAHIFRQTTTTLSYHSDRLAVTSSRGFARELAPMKPTSAHRSRRYTIDVTVTSGAFPQERNYLIDLYNTQYEDFEPPLQPRSQQARDADRKKYVRQTDEPTRQLLLSLPDPLRYRDFHRWGFIRPPYTTATYLSLEMGAARIDNPEFCSIVNNTGTDSWYENDVIDMALYLLSRYYKCEANGIGIVDSNTIMCIRYAGFGPDEIGPLSVYKSQLEDKKWIFVPLNEGMKAIANDAFHGSHWSLLAIDRINRCAHYVDGWGSTRYSPEWHKLAEDSARAVGSILGEQYPLTVELGAPDQWSDNTSGQCDFGPCGPYVIKMIQLYVEHLIQAQRSGLVNQIKLGQDAFTQNYFRQRFNSYNERWSLVYTIAGVKASQVANVRAAEHEQAALGSIPAAWTDPFDWKPAPMFYDPAMFTEDALTHRQYKKHQNLQIAAQLRYQSMRQSDTSSSSGGILLPAEVVPVARQSARTDFFDGVKEMDIDMDRDDGEWVRIDRKRRSSSTLARPGASSDVDSQET